MKKYLALLLFNIAAYLLLFLAAMLFGGSGGNSDPSYAFIGIPLIAIISLTWFIYITIRYRNTIFENRWGLVPALLDLIISIQGLRLLYFLVWNKYLR